MNYESASHQELPEDFFTRDTADEVLRASWADPADPRTIDFSTRQSIFEEMAIDAFGRGVNPRATSDMGENRGQLAHWRANLAADAVVVGYDARGKRRILLIERMDEVEQSQTQAEEWALPGGMIEAGEMADQAARRELCEETGVDLSATPARQIFKGYVDDPRNTKHAWIETTASLMVTHHLPAPRADGVETRRARWFDFESMEALQAQTGSLYASHAEIILHALVTLEAFERTMRSAQTLHGRGDFAAAVEEWSDACELTVDPLQHARALRGLAASQARMGERFAAISQMHVVKLIGDAALAQAPDEGEYIFRRERGQSALVLGSLIVGQAVQHELRFGIAASQARQDAAEGVTLLDEAIADITQVELLTGEVDQYRINILSRLALAHALYGDRNKAKQYAREAARLGWQSESKRLPTSAKMSISNTLRAKARAVPRGYAAWLATRVARPAEGVGRSAALTIASNRFIGL